MLSQFCNVKPLNIHAPRVSLMFITRSFVMHAQMRLGFICNHYIVVLSKIAKKNRRYIKILMLNQQDLLEIESISDDVSLNVQVTV